MGSERDGRGRWDHPLKRLREDHGAYPGGGNAGATSLHIAENPCSVSDHLYYRGPQDSEDNARFNSTA